MTRATRVAIAGIAVAVIVGAIAWRAVPYRTAATSRPTTTPLHLRGDVKGGIDSTVQESPSLTEIAPAPPPADLLAVLKLDNPAWAKATPLDLPTDLTDAAKIVLHHPAYVDPLGNLWITHPQGRPINEVLAGPIADHTAVVRERVRLVRWPTDGIPTAIVGEDDHLLGVVPAGAVDVTRSFDHPDFGQAIQFDGGAIVPTLNAGPVLLFDGGPGKPVGIPPAPPIDPHGSPATHPIVPPLAFAPMPDGAYIWASVEGDLPQGVGRVRGHEIDELSPQTGWPERVREVIPLADESVLVLYESDDGPALKLIQGKEKPPSTELIRTITALAQQLADPEPLKRDEATRAIEAQGAAAYPVLESLREQLPAEAQVRIENLLGQRFAPTLGGLRPGPGKVRTLARFPGGGCVLQFDGGGTVGGFDENDPPRSVIPATVLIRPGHSIELIDPKAITDFVAGRQTIQSIGEQLIVSDPVVGPRRWVGLTLLPPLLPKELADFDTVVAIDARRRWLLTSKKRPGDTLLIDPTLPDPTPRLPVWTINAAAGTGRTDELWPAVRRGDQALVLRRSGWQSEKLSVLHEQWTDLPAAFDRSGRQYLVDGRTVHVTDRDGLRGEAVVPGDGASEIRLATGGGHLFVYSAEGSVHRYAVAKTPTGPKLTAEATFTAGIPAGADRIWIDPAGRLVMRSPGKLAIAFPDGRVPAVLRDVMLRVDR